ncbi:type IV toxin-antitoxin system AbiEi family antitoxin domain-containing protein [Myxococcota bacterium]|nr:type IV toxin-antitoxin system AbiEi family antitoxin domain-containing protein [Myxococcota bacterium]
MGDSGAHRPDWKVLYQVAESRAGYFTTRQAAESGFSPELLIYHCKEGRLDRARRGVYRLRQFPPTEHEELAIIWLWSDQYGVFSHETALSLYELSDALPSKIQLTLPSKWSRRRLRVPDDVLIYHADVSENERRWMGPVPVTSPERTLRDCIEAYVQPDLIEQALAQVETRGLVSRKELRELKEAFRDRQK